MLSPEFDPILCSYVSLTLMQEYYSNIRSKIAVTTCNTNLTWQKALFKFLLSKHECVDFELNKEKAYGKTRC